MLPLVVSVILVGLPRPVRLLSARWQQTRSGPIDRNVANIKFIINEWSEDCFARKQLYNYIYMYFLWNSGKVFCPLLVLYKTVRWQAEILLESGRAIYVPSFLRNIGGHFVFSFKTIDWIGLFHAENLLGSSLWPSGRAFYGLMEVRNNILSRLDFGNLFFTLDIRVYGGTHCPLKALGSNTA